jgi:hypothetical protein
MFVPEPVLAEMLLQMLPPPPRVWGTLALSESQRGEQALACPDCTEAMKATKIHEVELDHCPKHGVWFDQDELRVTLYRVADPKHPPPFNEWAPSPFVARVHPPKPVRQPPPPKPRPSGRKLTFHVVQPGEAAREVVTDASVIKVGKTPSCQLRLDNDDKASRMHAVIEVMSDEITVIDLGSVAGTFVNDTKVARKTLEIGDTIRLGATELVLVSAT